MLERLPYKSYINLGLESYDDATLKQLGKPIDAEMVRKSFEKMVIINSSFANVEISANFLIGTTFSDEHKDALIDLLSGIPKEAGKRGCVYLSPLVESISREQVLPMFHEIKNKSAVSAYVYLIQRL